MKYYILFSVFIFIFYAAVGLISHSFYCITKHPYKYNLKQMFVFDETLLEMNPTLRYKESFAFRFRIWFNKTYAPSIVFRERTLKVIFKIVRFLNIADRLIYDRWHPNRTILLFLFSGFYTLLIVSVFFLSYLDCFLNDSFFSYRGKLKLLEFPGITRRQFLLNSLSPVMDGSVSAKIFYNKQKHTLLHAFICYHKYWFNFPMLEFTTYILIVTLPLQIRVGYRLYDHFHNANSVSLKITTHALEKSNVFVFPLVLIHFALSLLYLYFSSFFDFFLFT